MMLVTAALLVQVICILCAVAYLTLLERKFMAAIQRRRGPMTVGLFGLLQPLADGLKLFAKEIIIPVKANKKLFVFAPVLFLALAIVNWSLMPLGEGYVIADLTLGLLFVLAVSSFSVYGLILGGWASNSQYAFLGALRSAAQMISYEITLSLLIFCVVLLTRSLNLTNIIVQQEIIWFIFPLFPVFILFFISSLAETSRPPFDLPEAEAELVSGYNVEYSSMGFAFFFIAEYMNIIFINFLTVALFVGGWLFTPDAFIIDLTAENYISVYVLSLLVQFLGSTYVFVLKSLILILFFIWIRAALPRYRYDQLMTLTWRRFLPFIFCFFVLTFSLVFF